MDSTILFIEEKFSFQYSHIIYSCAASATYCGGGGAVSYGNCAGTACGSGLCCTRYG
jgi:hypothetical protein